MSQQQNNQNQNQGSLGSRFSRGSNNNNNQNQNQNNTNNNPFSRGSSPARSSYSNSRQNSQNNTNQNNRPNPPSRFGNLPSRFGSSQMSWYIEPLEQTFVRFNLDGLGDPFHRLLGEKLDLTYADPDKLVEAFENGGDKVERLIEQMENAWQAYDLCGAVIVYPWSDEIKQVIAANPLQNTNNDADVDDEDNDNQNNNNNVVAPITASQCLRAIDMLLVLNVLARTRADLLLANAPMALESGFMNRSLVTNDPRLVVMAQATGCVEEHFTR